MPIKFEIWQAVLLNVRKTYPNLYISLLSNYHDVNVSEIVQISHVGIGITLMPKPQKAFFNSTLSLRVIWDWYKPIE